MDACFFKGAKQWAHIMNLVPSRCVCVCAPRHTSVECNLWERMTIEQATGARCAAITVTVPEGGVTTLYSKVVTHTSAQASSKSSCRCAFQHEPMGYSHVNLNSKDTYLFFRIKSMVFSSLFNPFEQYVWVSLVFWLQLCCRHSNTGNLSAC